MANHNCEKCGFRAKYDRDPRSLLGRIWRWHANWCPGQEIFFLNSVRPQMVDFGSGQGLSNFETGVIASYFEDSAKASLRAQKSENAALGQKMPFVDGH